MRKTYCYCLRINSKQTRTMYKSFVKSALVHGCDIWINVVNSELLFKSFKGAKKGKLLNLIDICEEGKWVIQVLAMPRDSGLDV
ncbi:unnamed protein product [Diabrotica balteata]|uniref:Uncharacterized protein n=1 Tax=Diabrotica balteata TaxID=107213 RepID=A0A9N9STL0_DIABA|nr:unnamed protein product [Diabrotica balteata]